MSRRLTPILRKQNSPSPASSLLQRKGTDWEKEQNCAECKQNKGMLQRRAVNQTESTDLSLTARQGRRSPEAGVNLATAILAGTALGQQSKRTTLPKTPLRIQAKLVVGQPNDKYEQEADRIAGQVMRMPEPRVQRQPEPDEDEDRADQLQLPELQLQQNSCPCDGGCPKCQTVQPSQEPEVLQTKCIQTDNQGQTSAPSIVHDALAGLGKPLDSSVRGFMEPRFGHDFSQVRIYTNEKAVESSRALNALAYTVGQNIVFNAGQYQPHTITGRQLLAHELSHTIQQRAIGPNVQRAMKFEFETTNVVWRTRGKRRKRLTRKFGPKEKPKHSRFLHKGLKGKPAKGAKEGTAIELQSEARGLVEFETPSWHRKWCAIKKRILEAVSMVEKINKSKVVRVRGKTKTVEFPFDIKHLKKTRYFREGLKAGESLEVEIVDPTWKASIQASESFELSQFQTYLEEHLPGSSARSITGSAEKILQAANIEKIPEAAIVHLRNFLQIIIEHIMEARKWSLKYHKEGRRELAKEHISLMSRTNFSSIYRTLLTKEKEQKLFIKIVKSNAIPNELGFKPNSYIFPKGFVGSKSPGPKIREWLVSIYDQKRDLLSSLGGDNRALGRFLVDTRPGKKHTNLVKFETRATVAHAFQERPYTEWVAFAEEVFKSAHSKRARMGSTELIYDPEKCP